MSAPSPSWPPSAAQLAAFRREIDPKAHIKALVDSIMCIGALPRERAHGIGAQDADEIRLLAWANLPNEAGHLWAILHDYADMHAAADEPPCCPTCRVWPGHEDGCPDDPDAAMTITIDRAEAFALIDAAVFYDIEQSDNLRDYPDDYSDEDRADYEDRIGTLRGVEARLVALVGRAR